MAAGLIGLGLVGCATPAYNYQAIPKNISKPPIGSVNKAFVGDQMLEQGMVVDREVLNPENIKISFAYSLTSGIYLKQAKMKKGNIFSHSTLSVVGMVQKNPLADPFKVVMLDTEGKLCVVTVFNAKTVLINIKLL